MVSKSEHSALGLDLRSFLPSTAAKYTHAGATT